MFIFLYSSNYIQSYLGANGRVREYSVPAHSAVDCFSLSAICTNPCLNGGTCTAPETCNCDLGWMGNQCKTSKCISKPKRILPCLCPAKVLDAFCVYILCSVHWLYSIYNCPRQMLTAVILVNAVSPVQPTTL